MDETETIDRDFDSGVGPGDGAVYADATDCCIFVVDDSFLQRELICDALMSAGFTNVVPAEGGEQALFLLAVRSPDLVILDLNMPGMDGFETCEALRADPRSRNTPILIESATLTLESINRLFSLGASDILVKPFRPQQLVSRVSVHLQNSTMVNRLQHFEARMKQELLVARETQVLLCPSAEDVDRASRAHNLEIASLFRPTEEIGGDIWGILDAGDRIHFYLADFTGHGIAAALNTVRLHTIASRYINEPMGPAEILRKLNTELCELLSPGVYATMLWLTFDTRTRRLKFANAGARPPVLIRENAEESHFVELSGMPLGFLPSARYAETSLKLHSGTRLLFMSDALVEAKNSDGAMLGEDGLLGLVAGLGKRPTLSSLIESLLRHVELGHGFQFDDDLTILGIRAL